MIKQSEMPIVRPIKQLNPALFEQSLTDFSVPETVQKDSPGLFLLIFYQRNVRGTSTF